MAGCIHAKRSKAGWRKGHNNRSSRWESDRMSGIVLCDEEENELFILLKPREGALPKPLSALLQRVERSLYARLTIEEMERLSARFSS